MKIGLVKMSPLNRRSTLSGVTSVVTDWVAALERKGHEVSVLALKDYISPDESPARRYLSTMLGDRSTAKRVEYWLHENKIEILHMNTALHQSFRILRRPAPCPVVQSVHTFEGVCPLNTARLPGGEPCTHPPGGACVRAGCRTLRKYLMHDVPLRGIRVALSRFLQRVIVHNRLLEERFPMAGLSLPVSYVPLGVDIAGFRSDAPPREGRVLYAGRVRPEKGVVVLVEAMKMVQEVVPGATLTVAGSGEDLDRVKELARRLNLEESVDFRGIVPRDELADLYSSAMVSVVPSTWEENFGMVGLEAMAGGTPVVASDLAGIREWLTDGENGLLVPPGDAAALASALITLLSNGELRKRMSQKARERAEEFDIHKKVEMLCTVYEEVLGHQAGGLS